MGDMKGRHRRTGIPGNEDLGTADLDHLKLGNTDSTRRRVPSAAVKLSPEERKLLSDPDWLDEDEADLIMSLRVERAEGRLAIPFEEYLKKRGRRLAR